jgi:hypothetical protein
LASLYPPLSEAGPICTPADLACAPADRPVNEQESDDVALAVLRDGQQVSLSHQLFVGQSVTADTDAELRALVRNPSSKPLLSQLCYAACRGMDADLYHPDEGRPTDLALARCQGCQARLACVALALRAEDPEARTGWYGGLGPAERDALVTALDLGESKPAPASDTATRAVMLRASGCTVRAIAAELGCSRRTVQRYLRRTAA